MLNTLTTTRRCTVRYRNTVTTTAVTVLFDCSVHRTVVRRALVIGQCGFMSLMPLNAIFIRLPSFPLRCQSTAGTVLRGHQSGANGIDRRLWGNRNDVGASTRRRYGVRLRWYRVRIRIREWVG